MDDLTDPGNGLDVGSDSRTDAGDDAGSDSGGDAGSDSGGDAGADIDFVLVAAVAENGVIGTENGMPWHYPTDLAHFKELTTGHPVVVGRTTYEGIVDRIGGPLPDRTNVVLTTSDLDLPDGAIVANDLTQARRCAREAAAEHGVETVYVVGGGTVYEEFLDGADRMVITEIPESPDGHVYFPDRDGDEWVEIDREVVDDLAFVTYERSGD